MKKSFVFLASALMAAMCATTLFTSCLQDAVKDVVADQQTSTLGFIDTARPDVEKFIPAEGERIEGRYIVQLTNEFLLPGALVDTASTAGRESASRLSGARLSINSGKIYELMAEFGIGKEKASEIYTEAISGFAAELGQDEVKRLLSDRRVLSVSEDFFVQREMPEIEVAQGVPEYQVVPCGITRHNGPGVGPSSKWIWIVDSGISLHQDLNVETNTTYARSFVGGSPFNDCIGHGTHIAGTAAAKNNSIGVVGMSAGARVVPVRIFGCSNGAPLATILSGINHVALYDESGDVCNLSLGGYYGSGCSNYSPYRNAVTNMAASGTRVVISAGNDGANAAYYHPACINGTRIYTVANMDCYNNWNWSSNYGTNPVDWIAVGTNVYSTLPNNQYGIMSGTSMSAPHVSGIVHARQGNPAQCGWVYRYEVGYKVACR
ncbi:MAG: S8 family serine peptidase [Lewinellaceae bacterium]|nr:S8 family serine peptidase [Saprospiraceae bacterium]MCB9336927.1 S8 family serine peptidase [Lewinellaceae bacterium]